MRSFRLPHPIVLLLGAVVVAAVLTWILPSGEFNRHEDAATGRQVVVAGTYHAVERAPVGLWAAVVSVPRGFVEAADVVIVVLLAGGAFVILDKLGVLTRAVTSLARRLGDKGLWAIPIVSLFFYVMGGLENMQEEIIPLVPVLLLLVRAVGADALTAIAISGGAAMAGSALSPINPFQAGIALKLAEQPAGAGFALRLSMFVVGFVIWCAYVMRYAARHRTVGIVETVADNESSNASTFDTNVNETVAPFGSRDLIMVAMVMVPLLVYVYGTLNFDWGFNELSAGFLLGGIAAGLVGGLNAAKLTTTFLDGMGTMLPAALLIAVARSISVVLRDGKIIDTILNGLATPLSHAPASFAAFLMIPFHMLVHIPVPSASGHAVLTMPLLVPLSDLLNLSRQATVLSYQAGTGLMEFLTPTNGALMAMLLAARVSFASWLRFAIGAVLLLMTVFVVALLVVTH